ncbi:MAG: 4Fe-4S dicluster domain-containing protein [Proteobacteria bacterium]|nr:4Fe-4S dicluster domain-containing protein [Pseudomonadota bacterium]
MSAETVPPLQRPCIHCGDCARACPAALDPQALFFALVAEDWPAVQRGRLDACTECNRCGEVCPSHIPLLDWLRWGKTELRRQQWMRERADAARARHEARKARLSRERGQREAARTTRSAQAEVIARATPDQAGATVIDKADVMAAIARGRAHREALARAKRSPAARRDDKDTP